jgi:hypothetical protein
MQMNDNLEQNSQQPQGRFLPALAGALAVAGVQAVGTYLNQRDKKKAEAEQRKLISGNIEKFKQIQGIKTEQREASQLQTLNRNINVMSASGFDVSSNDRLFEWLKSNFAKQNELEELNTQLTIAQMEAGKPVSSSGWADAFNIASGGFSTFANLGGFK